MDPILEYFYNNHDAIWYILGGVMLVVEAKILGLSTGILLFAGIGAMITGFTVSMGWVTGAQMQIAVFGLSSSVVTGALWVPFKRLQKNNGYTKDTSSDMIGMVVELTADASRKKVGKVRWSGIDWKAKLDKSCPVDLIKTGEDVKITAVEAGKMTVTIAIKLNA